MPKLKPIEFYVDANGCHICTSHRLSSSGYPHSGRNGKTMTIARIILEQRIGPLPRGHETRHTCHVRTCINPDHLLSGTTQDNCQDRINRSRLKEAPPPPRWYDFMTKEEEAQMPVLNSILGNKKSAAKARRRAREERQKIVVRASTRARRSDEFRI